jgi:hypothetical protein
MNKQDHSKSFVIEVSIVPEGVHEIFVQVLIGVNFIRGSQDDYMQLTSPDFGSFGSPLFVEKVND